MAYNVSENYRNVVYSGEALYNCKLKFNNTLIPVSQISSIKISSPIIDSTTDTGSMFHIGTFISQKLDIQFKNLDGLDLTNNPKITLEIGMYVGNIVYNCSGTETGNYYFKYNNTNYQFTMPTIEEGDVLVFDTNTLKLYLDETEISTTTASTGTLIVFEKDYEYVPIGKYLLDELSENYQTTCLITCFDYAIKFNSNIDISQFFGGQGYILASDLFEAICDYYGVDVGTYPEVNNNKQIYTYDGTLTGKQYISYLAELFGGNAKIERDGSCSIIPLKNYTQIEINALTSKSFKIGSTYELSRVCYDNGKQKYQAGGNVISVETLPTTGIDENSSYYLTTDMKYYKYVSNEWVEDTNIKNTLYIRTDNLFIANQTEIDNIYNAVKDFSITNITCENRMDLSLDCWDIIKYTLDNNREYYTFYDNEINFNGVAMGKNAVNLPLKTTEETTNIITASNEAKIRRIQTTVNEQELEIQTVVEEVGQYDSRITSVEQDVDEIRQLVENTVDYKRTVEGYTQIHLTEAMNQDALEVEVRGNITYISELYPRTDLYPSTDLYVNMEGEELR